MCGIIGAVSKNKPVLPILINGLKTLEYRGYDSAGVSYFKNKEIKIVKSKGQVKELIKKLNLEDKTYIGIAHTRWATHGKANSTNAHPHKVKHITIVHNGIIENFEEIKNELTDNSYTFKTTTDTEIACALINYYYEKYNNINKAIIKFMEKAIGSYAIALLIDDDLENIYVLKKESPLIIGIKENTNFIASDVQAILKYTNKYYLLNDLEYAIVNKDSVKFFDKQGQIIKKELKEYNGDNLESNKGHYKHYMLKEIMEQKDTIKRTISNYINSIDSLLTLPDLTKYNRIDIVACGTAMHSGLVAKYLFQELTNTECRVYLASEYRYQNNFVNEEVLTIFISQSGETADTLAALKNIKHNGFDSLGIINVKESSIALLVDKVLYTEVGQEIAVASTKAYTAQVALLSLLVLSHGYRNKTINKEEVLKILKEFNNITNYIEPLLNQQKIYTSIAKSIYKSEDIFYIGRGLDYYLSMEGALKLKEISYIHSESYAAGELKHGTISLIKEKTPIFASATNKNINKKTISNLKEVIARGATVFLITDDKELFDSPFSKVITMPKTNTFLKAILTIIPYQLIAYYTANLKGCDIDKPKNLAKSVTVE